MYNRHIINSWEDYHGMLDFIDTCEGWLTFDTETTGLHLKKDTPFLLTITTNGNSFALEREYINQDLFDAFSDFDLVIGHNVKFDLHMLANIGITYKYNNLSDTMIMARLALDTDAVMSLALKGLSKKYLGSETGTDEKLIKSAITAIKRRNTAELKRLLRSAGKTKKWFDAIVKDTLFEPSDLGDFKDTYLQWVENYPDPTYKDVYYEYKEEMLSYAMNDTEITMDLAMKLYPSLIAKDQENIFIMENNLILPLLRMERVGLNIDANYLEESRVRTKQYILRRRFDLEDLAGEPIKVGQHKRIKGLFSERWGVILPASDDRALASVPAGDAKRAAECIRELRTLEKWYSAYICRMQDKSDYDGRAYTQINQASAVTGRVSSDFQQFPRGGIYSADGVELFHPRRAVVVTGENYESIFYLDYSQIELRVQAQYTLDVSGGDLNMCRAYMPFKCYEKNGKWYKEENDELWDARDLHTATAMTAFPDVDPKAPEFKHCRYLGKSTNFAKNYGATTKALISQFGFDQETAEKLNQAYYDTFPKILDYQKLVSQSYRRRGFVRNRYGRRYYLSNSRFVYKLYNYIVQGTSADMLKEKIILIDKLLTPYKTRFQMNIHDELSFEVWKGEEHLIPAIKNIMEEVEWMEIPVVADIEITKTNWADKEDYEV